jgi:hypothetical protein
VTDRVRIAFVLATGTAVVALGLAAEWVAYGPHGYLVNRVDATYPWVLDLVTGYVFLGSGLIATLRKPSSLVGPLFILAAAAWFASTLIEPPRYVGTAVTPSVVFLYRGFLAHAILAFPTGRPADRVEWSAIVIAYGASLFAPLGYGALTDTALVGLLVAVAWRGARHARGSARPARREAFHAAVLLALATAIVTAARALDVGGPPAEALAIGFHVALMAVVIRLSLRLIGSTRPELTDLVVELGAGARATMRSER